MKRKAQFNINILYIIGVFILLGLIVFTGTRFTLKDIETTQIALPHFGNIECNVAEEVYASPTGEPTTIGKFPYKTLKGIGTEILSDPDIFICPDTSAGCTAIIYADDNQGLFDDEDVLNVRIVDKSNKVLKRYVMTLVASKGQQKAELKLLPGERIRVGTYDADFWVSKPSKDFLIEIDASYEDALVEYARPYTKDYNGVTMLIKPKYMIYTNSLGHKENINDFGCNLFQFLQSEFPDNRIIVDSSDNDLDLQNCGLNSCNAGGVANWIEYWSADEIISDVTIEYQGSEYICWNFGGLGKLYTIGTLETKTLNGQSRLFIYPEKDSGKSVPCCPGLTYGNSICVQDGDEIKLIAGGEISCKSDLDCPGQNLRFIYDTTDPNYIQKSKCTKGTCEYYDRKKAECTPTGSECGATGHCIGGFCVDKYTEEDIVGSNKQECINAGGKWVEKEEKFCEGALCIFGITQPTISRTSTCLMPEETGETDILIIIVVAVLVALVLIYIVNKKMKEK